MTRYRSKNYVEAFQYDGDFKGSDGKYYVPDWASEALEEGLLYYKSVGGEPCELFLCGGFYDFHIEVGYYLVRNNGIIEFYDEESFYNSYEAIV